jgi:hypothetical protein
VEEHKILGFGTSVREDMCVEKCEEIKNKSFSILQFIIV